MNYLEIIFVIMTILTGIIFLFTLQYIIIIICGIFTKQKKFPEAEEKLKYGVVIAGRNEEKVIGSLIESIRKCNYPQDKIDVFVVAHNCTDNTANVARESGGGNSQVYEYNNPSERTKGYALKYIFKKIDEDFGIMNYDGFIVFDADNILDSEFFNKINDAFVANDKKCAITSFRNSKNFGANTLTAMYGLMFITNCTIESGGRMALNCSTRLLGSGFLVSSEMVKDGWNNVDLSDDTDFTAEQILQGHKVIYCNEAMYYDEHPTTIKEMWRQRLRWAKGGLIMCKKHFCELFKTTFGFSKKKEKRLRGSALDLINLVFPFAVVSIILLILNIILISFCPLFGFNIGQVFLSWLITLSLGVVVGYLGLVLLAIVCYVKERKRIRNVSKRVKFFSVALFPIFTILIIPLQIVAMFTKKFSWKQNEHKNTAKFETFNETPKDVLAENVLTSESVLLENDMTREKIERGEVK